MNFMCVCVNVKCTRHPECVHRSRRFDVCRFHLIRVCVWSCCAAQTMQIKSLSDATNVTTLGAPNQQPQSHASNQYY